MSDKKLFLGGTYIARIWDGYGHIPKKGYFCVDCWANMHVTQPDLRKKHGQRKCPKGIPPSLIMLG